MELAEVSVCLQEKCPVQLATLTSSLLPLSQTPTVRLLTEGDDTRGCGDKIGPPDDEQRAARNILRSVV